jgi:AcrR family transcriptional regulator
MPKVVDHPAYRKRLLALCFDLFAQRGYSALTMRQIATELDVSTGTLYHYFPTKEALFQQLVEEVTQQTVFEAIVQIQQHSDPEARLTALFDFLAQHEEQLRKQLLVILDYYQHRDLYGSAAGKILRAGADRYCQALQSYLHLPDQKLVVLLTTQVNGLLVQRMLRASSTPFVEQARPFITMFVAFLHTTEAECSTSSGIEVQSVER